MELISDSEIVKYNDNYIVFCVFKAHGQDMI